MTIYPLSISLSTGNCTLWYIKELADHFHSLEMSRLRHGIGLRIDSRLHALLLGLTNHHSKELWSRHGKPRSKQQSICQEMSDQQSQAHSIRYIHYRRNSRKRSGLIVILYFVLRLEVKLPKNHKRRNSVAAEISLLLTRRTRCFVE